MRRLLAVVGFFATVASCGFDPKPKNGRLPCDNGCPSGYVCGAGNRCWLTNAPVGDSGADSLVLGKDAATAELGGADVPAAVDSVLPEAGKEIFADTSVAVDVGSATDVVRADTGTTVDTASADGADGSTVDAPVGTGGSGGAGGAGGVSGGGGAGGSGGGGGSGGSSGSGGAVVTGGTSGGGGVSASGGTVVIGGASGSGGVSATGGSVVAGGTSGSGGASGIGGAGGSNADAAPDVPQGNPDAACVPESDQQMCTRLAKNCNAFSGTDNCGQPRSITSCGTCEAAYLVCGTFVANVCPPLCVLDQTANLDECVLGQ
jgi:hypothetical protein